MGLDLLQVVLMLAPLIKWEQCTKPRRSNIGPMDWIQPVEVNDLACGPWTDFVHGMQCVKLVWYAGWTWCHECCTQLRGVAQGSVDWPCTMAFGLVHIGPCWCQLVGLVWQSATCSIHPVPTPGPFAVPTVLGQSYMPPAVQAPD